MGQPVVIRNRGGAAGTLGASSIARSQPDGYTISQMPITVFRIPYIQKVDFDPMSDFSWIIGVTGYTFGVVVAADSPWRTWQDLIAYAKSNPGKVSYASPGVGTSPHITMEEIAQHDGIQWTHVPFKGQPEGLTAVIGGHVTAQADSAGWASQADAGRVRLLVTWGEERTKHWPDVPTLKELGYGIVSRSPYGIAGPKGMDPKVIAILHDAIKRAMEDPQYMKVAESLDQERWYLNSEEYTRFAHEFYPSQKAVMEKLKQ